MTLININLTTFEKIEIINQRINLLDFIVLSNEEVKNSITELNDEEISNPEEYNQFIQEIYNIKQALEEKKNSLENQG
jgi:hypothetical protein